MTVIAAMRTCGPQLMGSHPAALDGWLARPEPVEGRPELLVVNESELNGLTFSRKPRERNAANSKSSLRAAWRLQRCVGPLVDGYRSLRISVSIS